MTNRRSFLKTAALSVPALTRFHAAPGPAPFPDPDDVAPAEFWEEIRKLYTLSPNRIYLNTGGLGPAPDPVLNRFREETDRLQMQSETGHRLFDAARETVATFFGADPDELAFTRNATEGNATVAAGLRLNSGDEIIIDASAHPGGAIPWLTQLKRYGVRVRTFQPDSSRPETTLERIEALVSTRTRVIQISHVTAPTGILLPAKQIAEIAARRRLWFHIDGAQSAGMLPIDLHDIGCDSYATSGHKWLGAPHGTGILYIRQDRLDDVWPTEVGAYSDAGYHLPDTLEFIPTARRYESGTRNAPLVAAVAEAASFMSRIGLDRVRERGLDLTRRLRAGLLTVDSVEILTPEPEPMRGSILTFRSEKMAYSELNQALSREHHLRLRVVTEQDLNAIRVSLHVFNSEEHVDRVVEGVREALG
jgi:selenocysteine lyase/cysteine desulfurase